MILKQRTVYHMAYLQAEVQDNLSVQSGVNAQFFSSVLTPFSNYVSLNGIALDTECLFHLPYI